MVKVYKENVGLGLKAYMYLIFEISLWRPLFEINVVKKSGIARNSIYQGASNINLDEFRW